MRLRVSTRRPGVAPLLSLLVALAARSPLSLLAQSAATDSGASPPRPVAAASPIAVSEVARDLTAFATDSLRARGTPSAGLAAAAAYVASEFQRLGLRSEVQEYPVPGQQRVDVDNSLLWVFTRLARNGKLVVKEGGERAVKMASLSFKTDLYFAPDVERQTVKLNELSWTAFGAGMFPDDPLILMAGRYTPALVRQLADTLRGRIVLYVPPADADTIVRRQVITALYAVAQGVIVAGASDSGRFAAARAQAPEAELADKYMRSTRPRQDWNCWVVVASGARLDAMLAVVGEDLERLRASDTPIMRTLALSPTTTLRGKLATDNLVRAPNVIGTLQGGDSALRDEVVFLVAPLDTRGSDAGPGSPAERLDSGTRDGASAVAGLLALARAFAQPGQQPRRSIVFLAASGGPGEELWGAKYFVTAWPGNRPKAAALAMDRLGRWPGDSVVIDGLRDVEATPSPLWVAASHPESNLRIVDGGTAAQPVADHFAFVRAMTPSLYVHAAGDSNTGVADAAQVVRGARLIFYLAQALANADRRPHWTAEGRHQLSTVVGP